MPVVNTPSSVSSISLEDAPFGLHSVCSTLRDAQADLQRFAWLGDGIALAEWRRWTDVAETVYDRPGHHTLSCYLDGGHRTERQRHPGYGAPNRLCALPGEHESKWWVRGDMHFVHLYFLPDHFERRAVRELDCEPREMTLADRTYFENERLARLCQWLAGEPWDDADGMLRANEAAHEVLSLLIRSQSVRRHGPTSRGGLSSAVRRRLYEYIEANLSWSLTIGELADVACLSEFHLARMFRVSFGLPPHAWIALQRAERARQLLRGTSRSLEAVAALCGYASASHFSHRFRAAVGVTPSAYRRALSVRE